MKKDEIDESYEEAFKAYYQDIDNHNNIFIKSLGTDAEKDFKNLMEDCDVNGKIEFVDQPKGMDNEEDVGFYKKIHVEQWTSRMESDNYTGYLYALIPGNKWIKVPYTC